MQKKYDVIIAGAGPAGLMTAQVLGEKGARVLLLDIKKDIARVYRACCANLIIEPDTHRELTTYAGGAFHFAENKFSIPYSGAIIELKRSVKISAGGNTLIFTGKSPEGNVALSFDKEILLQGMLAKVSACSTIDIMPETQALRAENTAGGVAVTLRSGGREFIAGSRIAVAADGVNSSIVESLGLNKTQRTFFARFMVASYHMEGVDCPYPKSWITFMGKGHTLGGRGQLYMCPKPHGGSTDTVYELSVGVPALGPPAPSAQQELDHFINKGNFASWFKHARIIETRAAALNFATPLIHPVEGNVVVVGDAGAFIETYVQGAIMYGYQAARAIAQQLATGSGLDAYARSWENSFEYNDPEEIKLATQGFGLHVLEDDDINYLFSLTEGDDIRGFVNEFSEPETVSTALFNHMAQIERQRPDLAAKLKRFSEVSVAEALQIGSD